MTASALPALAARVEAALGRAPLAATPLGGGCVGEVYRLDMAGGERLVAKLAAGSGPGLALEGWMLSYLAQHSSLPVPAVVHAADGLLVIDWIDGPDRLDAAAEGHAAELVAALHGVTADRFGLERDTLIGGLHQPNRRSASWLEFFRDHRLLYMAGEALAVGRLPTRTMARIEALASRLDRFIDEPPAPALLHGDLWTGNVLVRGGRIAGFIDPAIYYGDPEMDLAFSTLFGTFNRPFFDRYAEIAGLREGFFEVRRDICNLYPLLVHVRLFGGSYLASVDGVLRRLGF